jgi:hypothetical protein
MQMAAEKTEPDADRVATKLESSDNDGL